MNRREFFSMAAGMLAPAVSTAPLILPIHHILDARAKFRSDQISRFWSSIWPEAVRDLGRGGVHLESKQRPGQIRRSPSGQPLFDGLEAGVLNFVVTDRIPIQWDQGRGLSGVTTRYRGYHLCVVALRRAHGHQIPFLSVNTCVHELLHALLHDIFELRPSGWLGEARELRIDAYATRLWLLRDGGEIMRSAQSYIDRLRSNLPRQDEPLRIS